MNTLVSNPGSLQPTTHRQMDRPNTPTPCWNPTCECTLHGARMTGPTSLIWRSSRSTTVHTPPLALLRLERTMDSTLYSPQSQSSSNPHKRQTTLQSDSGRSMRSLGSLWNEPRHDIVSSTIDTRTRPPSTRSGREYGLRPLTSPSIAQEAPAHDPATQRTLTTNLTHDSLAHLRSSRRSVHEHTDSDYQTVYPSTPSSTSRYSLDIDRALRHIEWDMEMNQLREETERLRGSARLSTPVSGEDASSIWSPTRGWVDPTRNGLTPITYLKIGLSYWTLITNNIHELLDQAGLIGVITDDVRILQETYKLSYQDD
jgi:hypothetical protein